jgi:N6-L-threonylcarbamoyladenine synthase
VSFKAAGTRTESDRSNGTHGRGLVLGIETSCDDTCAAVVAEGREVLSSVVSSQDELHAQFGGVVPEHASRQHLQTIVPAVRRAMDSANAAPLDLCGIAVTAGPGLVGSLLVGISTAKALSLSWELPLIAVNHVEAHAYAPRFGREALSTEHLCLTVSGGHTSLLHVHSPVKLELVGCTLDDSAGEAFDKVASYLGLGYPGGPALERIAAHGDPCSVELPRPVIDSHGFDFSFSGLKTAVLVEAKRLRTQHAPDWQVNLAAAFQAAVVEVLVHKTFLAAGALGVSTISICGGVASNTRLRREMARRAKLIDVEMVLAPPEFCTDNAAMVAGLGWHLLRNGSIAALDLDAFPGWRPGDKPQ